MLNATSPREISHFFSLCSRRIRVLIIYIFSISGIALQGSSVDSLTIQRIYNGYGDGLATLTPVFNKYTWLYSTFIPNQYGNIKISALARNNLGDPTTYALFLNGVWLRDVSPLAGPSPNIPINVGINRITISPYATTYNYGPSYTVNITRGLSAVCTLSYLKISSGILSPNFTSATLSYTASVPSTVSSLTVTPTRTDVASIVKVNEKIYSSGSSESIPLLFGNNTITVLVTAEDGTTKVYTVKVTRTPSTVSSLAGLTLSSGTLSPVFASGTMTYTASMPSSVKSLQLTPTVMDSTANVKINGVAVASGAASPPISLSAGGNLIQVVATAQDGSTTSSYTVTVFWPSAVTTLSGLTCNSGSLSPAFGSGTTAYAVNIANDCTGVTLTPTLTEPNATVRVNGNLLSSGTASAKIPVLASGSNVINVTVTALDGTTIQTYNVTVNRPPLNATFTNAATVPLNVATYDASGNLANLSLGYSPTPGTTLNLVKMTDLDFIQGRFTNLAQGQYVSMAYQGVVYRFAVNYYGGTGNDLVLQWASDKTYAWGANSYGQLGNNGASNSSLPTSVLSSGALSGKCVVAVAAGSSHSLALCGDGTLAAWGRNDLGQLGNNSTTNSSVPVVITNSGVLSGKTVVAISAGYYHNLALCSDGTVAAWGQNTYGQLGDGTNTNSSVPVAVTTAGGLSGKSVSGIAAGYYHNLAQCTDGSLVAWGRNTYGQLGNNLTTDSSAPVAISRSGVLSGRAVTQFAAGSDHSLVMCSDGSLAAWGRNNNGQLGEGSGLNSMVPIEVDSTDVLAGKIVTSISVGGGHNLALCSDGTLAAFGRNTSGQLGDGSTTNRGFPMLVNLSGLGGKAIAAVKAANSHSLALCIDGSIHAWGSSSYGQLGNGGTTNSSLPVAVTTSPLGSGERFMALATGTSHSMALVAAPPITGYEAWTAIHAGLSDSTALGDPDKDGIPNVLEYVLNGNPGVAAAVAQPVLSQNQSQHVFSFSRAAASAADTTQVFQYSTDLDQWTELSLSQPTDAKVAIGVVDGAGMQTVTVTIPKQGDMSMFGRLNVFKP
jgi:alpha-tubulin suppressor-like RCC1 family protein